VEFLDQAHEVKRLAVVVTHDRDLIGASTLVASACRATLPSGVDLRCRDRGGPDEGPSVCIALIEMAVNCDLRAGDGVEAVAPYALAREGRKGRLYRIQPGARC
jgi:hypothetical protein